MAIFGEISNYQLLMTDSAAWSQFT